MTFGTLYGNVSESNGLYGIGQPIPGSTYFQWFIFIESTGAPATPTGGSWDFDTNIGTPPTGWSLVAPQVPNAILWFSVAFVDSRNPTVITWSAPSLLSTATSIYATMYADVFTGNGSQTTWTLTASPVSINNLNVSINGVVQVPGVDYTFAGTTLTTTSAVFLGAVMLVKYGQALGTANFADNLFSIFDSVDTTKIATFEVSGLSTATTRTYTFPDVSGTFAVLSATQTFTGTNTFSNQLSIQGLTVGKGTGALANNTAFGNLALNSTTTGNFNCSFGNTSLQNNLTGIGNVGFGHATNRANTASSYNTAIGTSALQNGTGDKNVGIGNSSGFGLTTGSKNVIIGSYTGIFAPISQTGNNFVVLSDGDGNVRAFWNSEDATFNGALRVADPIGTNAAAPTLASGTVITPMKSISFVSGTSAISTVVPTHFAGAGGTVTFIPTGVFTWTTAGNIALAGTAVVNKALTMTYDSGTLKWYPSYIA
jgi:hypothetical protein